MRSVAEYIPSFLLAIFTTKSSRSSLTALETFSEAVDTTFVSEAILSKHPMVCAVGTSFFRYAASVGNRSPWSLPVPHCSACGPASQVFVRHATVSSATYRCRHCKMRATFEKPNGVVKVKEGMLWRVDWDTYLRWGDYIKAKEWTPAGPATNVTPVKEELQTLDVYVAREIRNLNPFILRALHSAPPNQPTSHLYAIFQEMQIDRVHWPKLAILLKGGLQDDVMDTT